MTALIIDLRNNPGGLLESARRIASEFIPSGQLIVSTEGRDLAQKSVYRSDGGKKQATIPWFSSLTRGARAVAKLLRVRYRTCTGRYWSEKPRLARDPCRALSNCATARRYA